MFPNFNSKLSNYYKQNHYAHNNQFDIIRSEDCHYRFDEIKKWYWWTLVVFIFAVAYGIVGLECESRPECNIDLNALSTSPYNWFHQMYPQVVWPQTHPMALISVLLTVCCLIVFSINPPIQERFLIYPSKETKNAFKAEMYKMCVTRERLLKFGNYFKTSVYISCLIFCYVNIVFINSVYNVNLTSFVFWIVLNPFHLDVILHYIYLVPFYVILASKCVTIQQNVLVDKLKSINWKLSKIGNSNLAYKRVLRNRLWLELVSVNRQICDLCSHLREYARFWSPYLTMLFAAFISIQCYICYVVLFFKQIPLVMRVMLLSFALGIVFVQFVLIHQCAAVVAYFKLILGQNRAFYSNCRVRQGAGSILARNLLKAESLQNSRLYHSYAFRLFGNYRITNKSFHIIISYIAIFFLYIVKNKH